MQFLADNINEEDEDKFVNGEVFFIKELGRKYEDLNLSLIDADTLIDLFKRSQVCISRQRSWLWQRKFAKLRFCKASN